MYGKKCACTGILPLLLRTQHLAFEGVELGALGLGLPV